MKFIFPSLLAAGLAAMVGCWTLAQPAPEPAVAQEWPEYSRLAAAKLVEEYGRPDQSDSRRLVWYRRGPWQRITLWNLAAGPAANLEQTVSLAVPAGKRQELAQFSGDIRISENGTRLSARSAGEPSNRLLLNLAYDIIAGAKSPLEARDSYRNTLSLAAAGKGSPLLERLVFSPAAASRPQWPIRLRVSPDFASRKPFWRNTP